jgi:hypothetical protein
MRLAHGAPFVSSVEQCGGCGNRIRFLNGFGEGPSVPSFKDHINGFLKREHEVGVDVERIRSNYEAEEIAPHFLNECERVRWHSLSGDTKADRFFDFWTSKEALFKASARSEADRRYRGARCIQWRASGPSHYFG